MSSTEKNKLLPCPYCGSEAKLNTNGATYIYCGCGVTLNTGHRCVEGVIKAWNKRVTGSEE